MRRRLLSVVLSVAAMSTGALPLLGTAHAQSCPSWTDDAGDSYFKGNSALSPTKEDNLDILKTTVTTVGKKMVVAVTVAKLLPNYSEFGDKFTVQMKIDGADVYFFTKRDSLVPGVVAAVTNLTGTVTGAATADYDTATNTVSISAAISEVDKAAAKPTTGLTANTFVTSAEANTNDRTVSQYDNSTSSLTYVVGTDCSPAIPDVALAMPRATCNDIADDPTDGTPNLVATKTANDPDLDVSWVAFNSTPKALYAYIKIATLGDKPSQFQGDRYDVTFTTNSKTYTYSVGRMGAGSYGSKPTQGAVGSGPNSGLYVKGVFDKTNSLVVVVIDRGGLDTVNGAAVPDDTIATGVSVKTYALEPAQAFLADTVQASAAADQVWKIGENKCFAPQPAKLTYVGKTSVQFTDAAAFAAKVTDAAGAVLSGKTVTFAVGGKTFTATTGSDGVARTTVNPGLAAGSYSLVTSFAGDSDAAKAQISTPFTVGAEKTKISLSVTKAGNKRTVTAKLLDDDGHPVAGQSIVWYINGAKVATGKTNAAGIVTLATAKPTQTVKAYFAGVSGKYLSASAQMKV